MKIEHDLISSDDKSFLQEFARRLVPLKEQFASDWTTAWTEAIPKRDDLELFYRGRAEHTPQGAGVGLFLSRQLARRMGGEITATSELGRGTCFMVSLPSS